MASKWICFGHVFRPTQIRKRNENPKDFTPEIIITNLKELREGMEGEMWLEVLIVEGINDSEEDLKALKSAIEEINPHKVQLNTVVRPGAYRIARPVSFEKLKKIADFLGEKTEIVVNKERLDKIIAKRLTLEREKLVEEILSYVKRRPATFKELMDAFLIDEKSLEMILAELVSENKIKIKKHQGEDYYIAD
jgi:wyosine [tRNA(Phe)-imidazoG37] synthetase (radical SAM superfamily)